MPAHIVVIGAGVIGLSCALELQQAGHAPVTLLARDFPVSSALVDPAAQINYTSPWGGAHNRWVPPPPPPPPPATGDGGGTDAAAAKATRTTALRDHALALATYHRMRALSRAHPEAGITFMKGVEFLERPGPEYLALVAADDDEQQLKGKEAREGSARALGIEGFRVLRPDELPDDRVTLGFEYDTWCVNPMVYCAFLLNRFVYRGGRVVRGEIRDPREVFAAASLAAPPPPQQQHVDDNDNGNTKEEEQEEVVVINASGQGFHDPAVFVTRGQTCLVAHRAPATVTRQNADGTWTFCVPRNFEGGTVIGGTKEVGSWDPAPSVAVRERLLRDFVATYPRILASSSSSSSPPDAEKKKKEKKDAEVNALTVLQDVVGRRPTRRGGARIETEEVAPGRRVVHAYGLGGRGFEMSWGVAEMVRELVEGGQSGPAAAAKARL